MKISKIKLTDFKGENGTTELSDRNLIVGDNFSGKTTLIDALSICLLGYHPQVGKTNKGLFQFASQESAGVEVTFDNGEFAAFGVYSDDGSSASVSRTPPTAPFATDNALLVQFDSKNYFGDTATKKVELLFSTLDVDDEELRDEIMDAIDEALRGLQDDVTDTYIEDIIDEMRNDLRDVLAVEDDSDDFERLDKFITKTHKEKKARLKDIKNRVAEFEKKKAELSSEINEEQKEQNLRIAQELEEENPRLEAEAKRLQTAEEWIGNWKRLFIDRPSMLSFLAQLDEEAQMTPASVLEKLGENKRKIKNLREEANQSEQVGEAERNLELATEEHQEYTEMVKAWEGAREALHQYKADRISGAMDGLLEIMNEFCEGITPRFCYEDGTIGYRKDYSNSEQPFIPYQTFSGTEKALVQMALGVALSSKGKFKLAILDELGRFDQANKKRILENAGAMIDNGKLDQFIGVDVVATESEGIQVISRGSE